MSAYRTFPPPVTQSSRRASLKRLGAVCIAFAVTAALRFFMLSLSAHPTGLDGYYYALQAKSLVTTGALENPAPEIGFYACGLCSLLCGDAIVGCKIWAALSNALIPVAVFVFLQTLFQKKRPRQAFTALLFAACSPSVTTLCVNYINNQTGLVFFFLYGASAVNLFRQTDWKKRAAYGTLTLALFVLCVFSHLVSAAYAFIFTGLLILKKLPPKTQAAAIPIGLLCGAALFFTQIPRFQNVFSLAPILPVLSPFMRRSAGLPVCLEVSAYFLAVWGAAVFVIVRKKRFDAAALLAPVLFFPFWRLDILDMGYRMMLNAVPASIIFIQYLLLYRTQNRDSQNDVLTVETTLDSQHDGKKTLFQSSRKTVYAVNLALSALLFLTPRLYNKKRDPPYDYYKRVVEPIELDDDSLLIAHLGLNHVYTYYKNLRDCLNYVPDFYVAPEKLWRLAYGVDSIALEQHLPLDEQDFTQFVRPIDARYVLIREDYWQLYLSNEDEEIAETYQNWFNPHTVRPAFIRKKAKSF
ncbi:MAG: glycosyltransferase family 39 protein [Treponema sp.]